MVGELIKDLRGVRGWSQGRLAAELNRASGGDSLNREYVSRWENGRRTPDAYWLRHLATVLEVPLAVLESGVKRRTFLTDVAATAIAPVVAADLLRSGFAAALSGGPSADDWSGKLVAYGEDYMKLGAAEIQRRLSRDLLVLQQQLEKPGMWQIAAKLMTLYAKTFPGSDGTKAVGWYSTAIEAADRSDDAATRVWVRGRAAIALGYEGAALGMADLFAEQALQIEEKPSLGRVNALMGKAHAEALRGNLTAALAHAEEGLRVFDVVGSGDGEESDYAVPYWRFEVFRSLLYARVGDEKRALDAQDHAAHYLPDSLPRFRTHLEMHKGLMLVRSGDRETGTAHAQAALDALPPEKHSLTLRMLMNEITA
ncbi:helix-turn-helix transcriptional regulator [Actinocorallia sp. A-T 12471]|uniref:helix-turn-helix domain-containing protein n=1 Tax=Actinocorallia sp. A-T 12471 TaxID=3089813 RepID=UPI0029CB7AC1|nr:helix-turn-helix transcriptional regulator [Actinocorallia sp. A-T 12471]MDX6738344.1 helix-turn-helix transcriptional regulator [Actinocorallia sp. A-T 12471]